MRLFLKRIQVSLFSADSVPIVKEGIKNLNTVAGRNHKERVTCALMFLAGFPKGNSRGIVGDTCDRLKLRNVMCGRDFLTWTEYVFGFIPIRRTLRLPPALVKFHDHGWLYPQVWGQEPPARPMEAQNVQRWCDAIERLRLRRRPSPEASKAVEGFLSGLWKEGK